MISRFFNTNSGKKFSGFVLFLLFSNISYAEILLDSIAAVVNEDVIMMSEVRQKALQVASKIRQQGQPLPPQGVFERQILENLIQSRLQLQLAERTGLRIDDESLNRTVSNIAAENNVSLSQFREILEDDGYSFESFREDIRNEIIINRLRQRQVDQRINVTDREIDNFLSNEKIQGNLETEIRLGHILIATPESATDSEKQEFRRVAEKVLTDLNTGKNFSDIAIEVSDGGNAAEGGDLGWRKMSEVPSLFSVYVASMQQGDISEIIESPSGFHIIKALEVRSDDKIIIEQTRARHILIKVDKVTTDEQASERLEQLRNRIVNGDNFATLAKGHSEDPGSAIEGGDLGWRAPGELVPKFQQVMDSLEPNQVSDPFKTQFGWHILEVLERRKQDSTESVKRSRARQAIHQRKAKEANENWLRTLRDEAYVEYRIDES